MPAPRYYAIAVTGYGGKILVAGGYDEQGNAASSAWQYDPGPNTWTAVADMSDARAVAAAALGPDRRIYVFGGDDGCGSGCYFDPLNTVEAYDPYANTWSAVTPMSRFAYGATAVTVGSSIYVSGGYEGGNGANFFYSEMDVFSVASGTWSTAAPLPRGEAYGGASLGPDGKLYAVGGVQFIRRHVFSPTPNVYIYDAAHNSWSSGPSLPQAVAESAVASAKGSALYSIGGSGNNNTTLTAAYALG